MHSMTLAKPEAHFGLRPQPETHGDNAKVRQVFGDSPCIEAQLNEAVAP